MAKKTDWMTMALYAGGAYLLYLWWTGEDGPLRWNGGGGPPAGPGELPSGAAVPQAASGGGVAPAPTPVTTTSPPETDVGGGAWSNGGNGAASVPGTTDAWPAIRSQMVAAAAGDPNPMNVWRWGWYYEHVTGRVGPDIDWGRALGTDSVDEAGQITMTPDEWLAVAQRWAFDAAYPHDRGGWNPTTGGFGGTRYSLAGLGVGVYAHGAYPSHAMPNQVANYAGGLARVAPRAAPRAAPLGRTNGASTWDPWGQDASGEASDWDWATPRYQSRGKEL